jgi:hypothetical protein
MPNLVPTRASPTTEDPTAPVSMQRFVHGILTTNPDTHHSLPDICVFLIELTLGCADWDALAHEPRFRRLDWYGARLAYP